MKKLILSFIMGAVFLGFSAPSHAALFLTQEQKDAKKAKKEAVKAEKLAKKAEKKRIKNLKKFYKPISSDMKIIDAMELMKTSPAIGSYEMITGDNYTEKPIKVEFENLSEIKKKYSNYDAVNRKKRGTLYIYVDKRHKNAPPEAIAALVSGIPVHINDKKDSVNEESYAWAVEAVVWGYLSRKNPEAVKQRSRLVNREEILRQQYEKSPRNAQYIVETVRKKRGDIRYKWESPGYNHKQYTAKIKRLYDIYNNNVVVLDAKKKSVFPVSSVSGTGLLLAPKVGDNKVQKGNVVENAEVTVEEPAKDEAQVTREKFEQYAASPVPVSSCKAPCSALGSASCPGSCPSICPNNKDVVREPLKEGENANDAAVTECPYCKVSAQQEADINDAEENVNNNGKAKKKNKKKKNK